MLLLTTSKKFWFSKLWLWNAWVCVSLGFLEAHPASLSFAKVRLCWALCSLPSFCFFMSQVSSSVRNQPGSKSLGFLVLPPTSAIFPTLAATVHSFFPLPTRCSFRSQLWFLILKSPFRSFYALQRLLFSLAFSMVLGLAVASQWWLFTQSLR